MTAIVKITNRAGTITVVSRKINGYSKLHYYDSDNLVRVSTGLPDNVNELAPHLAYIGGELSLSFIAGNTLYRIPNFPANTLPVMVMPTSAGFVTESGISYVDGNNTLVITVNTIVHTIRFKGVSKITEVTADPQYPAMYLISGYTTSNKRVCYLYNVQSKKLSSVTDGDVPAYRLAGVLLRYYNKDTDSDLLVESKELKTKELVAALHVAHTESRKSTNSNKPVINTLTELV